MRHDRVATAALRRLGTVDRQAEEPKASRTRGSDSFIAAINRLARLLNMPEVRPELKVGPHLTELMNAAADQIEQRL